jgi:hypothetical protein
MKNTRTQKMNRIVVVTLAAGLILALALALAHAVLFIVTRD